MAVKFTVVQIHPREEVLRQDGKPLLIGGGRHHLAPDGGDLLVCGLPADKAEVDPI